MHAQLYTLQRLECCRSIDSKAPHFVLKWTSADSRSWQATHLLLIQQVFALQDLYSFCSFVLVLQLAVFMLYAVRAAQYPVSTAPVIKHVADTLIASFPTGIPTVVVFSLFRCVNALKRHEVSVLDSGKIKTAAVVQIITLDKTGTLTGNLVTPASPTMRTACNLHCLLCEIC